MWAYDAPQVVRCEARQPYLVIRLYCIDGIRFYGYGGI